VRNAFESWIGQEVVVQLGFGPIKVSLRGVLLRDQGDTLLMRPNAGTDIEIAKTKVLALEEVERCSQSLPGRALLMSFIRNSNNPEIQAPLKTRT
jgi:hypothetical protein